MEMVEELESKGIGIKVEESYCGALLFADDIVLLAESEEELEKMVDSVAGYARKWKNGSSSLMTRRVRWW